MSEQQTPNGEQTAPDQVVNVPTDDQTTPPTDADFDFAVGETDDEWDTMERRIAALEAKVAALRSGEAPAVEDAPEEAVFRSATGHNPDRDDDE